MTIDTFTWLICDLSRFLKRSLFSICSLQLSVFVLLKIVEKKVVIFRGKNRKVRWEGKVYFFPSNLRNGEICRYRFVFLCCALVDRFHSFLWDQHNNGRSRHIAVPNKRTSLKLFSIGTSHQHGGYDVRWKRSIVVCAYFDIRNYIKFPWA